MNRLDEWLKERARREDCPVPQGFDGRMDAILEGLPEGRRKPGPRRLRRWVVAGVLAAALCVGGVAAASGALQQAELVSMRLVVDCSVRVSYAQFEQAQRIIAAAETRLDEPVFDDAVTLCWRMPAGQEGALCTALNELTRGGAEVEISKPQYAPF